MPCTHRINPKTKRCRWCGKLEKDCILNKVDRAIADMSYRQAMMVETLTAWAAKQGLTPFDVELVQTRSEDGMSIRWFFRRKEASDDSSQRT